MKRAVSFAVLVVVLALVSCGKAGPTPTPDIVATAESCINASSEYLEEIDDIIERWDEAKAVAASTHSDNLPGPVMELLSIRRDADDLEHRDCMDDLQDRLTVYMEATIDVYFGFMGDLEDEEMQVYFDEEKFEKDAFLLQWLMVGGPTDE